MQVSVETTSTLGRRLTIQVPAEKVDAAVTARLKQTAQKVRIDGFRPGKAPLSVVKQRYGEGVRQDVLADLMREHFVEAVQQEKLTPVGTPSIDPVNMQAGQPFEFVATFEVYPEVTVKTLQGEKVERPTAELTDDDLQLLIEDLRKQRATWEIVDAAAADGDQVQLDFEGFIDGEAFAGGQADGHNLVLGSNSFIPGFEAQLVGSKAGEEKEVKVTFPEDYQAANLAGKEAVFKCRIHEVKQRQLPELNDEFFSAFGVTEGGLEAFQAEVRKNMQAQLQQALRSGTKQAVFDALLKVNPVEIPAALIDNEVDNLRRQAVQQYNFGKDFDIQQIPADLFKDQATRNVTLGLLVGEYIKSQKLQASDEMVDLLLNEMAASYQEPEKVVEYYRSNQDMLRQVQAAALEQQVVDQLLADAEVVDVVKSFKELVMPAQ